MMEASISAIEMVAVFVFRDCVRENVFAPILNQDAPLFVQRVLVIPKMLATKIHC